MSLASAKLGRTVGRRVTWDVYLTDEVDEWLNELSVTDFSTYEQVVVAIGVLADSGPTLGRPLVDRVKGSTLHNLKELRPGSRGHSEVRILFAFDPWRSAILLTAGNKNHAWKSWYRENVPRAETLYSQYLDSRRRAEE